MRLGDIGMAEVPHFEDARAERTLVAEKRTVHAYEAMGILKVLAQHGYIPPHHADRAREVIDAFNTADDRLQELKRQALIEQVEVRT